MRQYLDLLKKILSEGDVMYEPRTQEHTIGLGGAQSVYDLRKGFPLVTTKRIGPRWPFEEVLWKLRGERSVKPLFDKNVHIWDDNAFDHYLKKQGLREKMPKHSQEWEDGFEEYKQRLKVDPKAEELGDLGPVYGYQWRHGFRRNGEEIDQLKNVIDGIKKNPGSRYHLMTAWNPSDLPDSALGPCPMTHHFNVFGDNLDLHVYQRSCDTFLGVPFNTAQDSFLNHLVAKETGLKARKFFHTYGNVHVYLGVPPRADFWKDPDSVMEFQKRFRSILEREKYIGADRDRYLGLKGWYLEAAPKEDELNEGKDHIPYVLTQLSKIPKKLPSIELKDVGFWDAIHMKAGEISDVRGYEFHEWDSKARMAV